MKEKPIRSLDLVLDLIKLHTLKAACKAKYRAAEVAAFLGYHPSIKKG